MEGYRLLEVGEEVLSNDEYHDEDEWPYWFPIEGNWGTVDEFMVPIRRAVESSQPLGVARAS